MSAGVPAQVVKAALARLSKRKPQRVDCIHKANDLIEMQQVTLEVMAEMLLACGQLAGAEGLLDKLQARYDDITDQERVDRESGILSAEYEAWQELER